MDQRNTPVARPPKSSWLIWPGCGVPCTVLMVSNNLSSITPSKGIDGMKQLLRIYILNDVCLSSLHLLSHTEKLAFGSCWSRYRPDKQEVTGSISGVHTLLCIVVALTPGSTPPSRCLPGSASHLHSRSPLASMCQCGLRERWRADLPRQAGSGYSCQM